MIYTPIKLLVFSILSLFNIFLIINNVIKLAKRTNKYLIQTIPVATKNSVELLTGITGC